MLKSRFLETPTQGFSCKYCEIFKNSLNNICERLLLNVSSVDFFLYNSTIFALLKHLRVIDFSIFSQVFLFSQVFFCIWIKQLMFTNSIIITYDNSSCIKIVVILNCNYRETEAAQNLASTALNKNLFLSQIILINN